MNAVSWVGRLFGRVAPDDGDLPPSPIADAPVSASEHLRHGNALLANGRSAEAVEQYRLAVSSDERSADAHVNLGFALLELGRPEEAAPVLERAIALAPASQDAHYLLGKALLAQRAFEPAIARLRQSIALKPALLVAALDLGKALHDLGRSDQAESVLRAALQANDASADLHHYLGNVQLQQMRVHEAVASYRRAIALQPDRAAVHSNMAPALLELCDFSGAAAAARRALALDPQMHEARSNLLSALSCDVTCTPDEYLTEARTYGAIVTERATSYRVALKNSTQPSGKRLRVGFVSGDLHNHPVGYFLDNVLAHWNDADMAAVAYSNHPARDDLTVRLQGHVSEWRDISGMSDDAAAGLIAADRIDVLIDLSGHTAGNRLPLFARRLAPVQVSWLGYWASTGVPEIDHVLADPVSVPVEQRAQFTENVWYLPDTRLCFSAPAMAGGPAVTPPPALLNGYVTFGSFQRLTKLNDAVLGLWARVLHEVSNARLRLQSSQLGDATARAQLSARLAAVGIDASRVQLVGPGTRTEYLAAHAEVDILLDTFPHSGATTTCEALWMGVPTVTLAGGTMLSRQGASLLTCAGLAEWVAEDEAGYVQRTLRWARDIHGLACVRLGLRDRVAASALFDAARFAAAFQEALLAMYQRRVAYPSATNPSSKILIPQAKPLG
jgi:protein O-GlcNAc transferase